MTKDEIKAQMRLFRMDMAPLPAAYIDLHQFSARISLPKLAEAEGFRVLHTEMTSDGWCDGMKVLRAVCEDKSGKLRDIRWSDSNGGSWFEKLESGQALLNIPDDRPGHM